MKDQSMIFLMTPKTTTQNTCSQNYYEHKKTLLAALSEVCHKQLSGMTVIITKAPVSLEHVPQRVTAKVTTIKTESSCAAELLFTQDCLLG